MNNHEKSPESSSRDQAFVNAVGRLESRFEERFAGLMKEFRDMKESFHDYEVVRAAERAQFTQALLDIGELRNKVASLEESRTKWKAIFLTVHGVGASLFAIWLGIKEYFKAKGP